ncbi:AEC family transporter [Anaerocolumna sp. AGMB13025]|uniref:AEC family transporter n=1 Tax=Anaerocolumna sp. AGMB13025 TaxID=3039116 RepID=UPI00241DDE59|nr:AEC family transporter [Anaerocolumna sp. AGMB13025]WFR57440.1 AEC family transporter [Anaerocolumna sp. AGMB13025]
MSDVNSQFLLSLLIIALGYISKRLNLVKEQDGEGISRIIFNFTLPSLVINTFSTIKVEPSLALIPVINIVYCTFLAALAVFFFKKEFQKNKGVFSMTSVGFNIGLFAYPLVEALWGKEGLKYFGMFDMGNALIVFGLCFFMASYYSSEDGKVDFKELLKKISTSVPLLVYILTLLLNVTGLSYPKTVLEVTGILSKANMPLSLLVLGIYLSFSFEKSYWKSMFKVLALRYGIGLLVGLLLFFTLPFEPMFRYTVLIGLVLPISMTVIPYSVQFNYDKKFVGTLTNFTIIISFILVWIIGLAVS